MAKRGHVLTDRAAGKQWSEKLLSPAATVAVSVLCARTKSNATHTVDTCIILLSLCHIFYNKYTLPDPSAGRFGRSRLSQVRMWLLPFFSRMSDLNWGLDVSNPVIRDEMGMNEETQRVWQSLVLLSLSCHLSSHVSVIPILW